MDKITPKTGNNLSKGSKSNGTTLMCEHNKSRELYHHFYAILSLNCRMQVIMVMPTSTTSTVTAQTMKNRE